MKLHLIGPALPWLSAPPEPAPRGRPVSEPADQWDARRLPETHRMTGGRPVARGDYLPGEEAYLLREERRINEEQREQRVEQNVPALKKWAHFPPDFVAPVDSGGPGNGERITGFGGIRGAPRDVQRQAVQRTPVILVHGNGTCAVSPVAGMVTMRDMLVARGYSPAEVWAVSWLGPLGEFDQVRLHQENVDDLRHFVDRVKKYLGVDKVDIIAHSAGATLTWSWLKGLSHDAEKLRWDEPPQYDKVGRVIMLNSALRGLGYGWVGEFRSNSRLTLGLLSERLPLAADGRPLFVTVRVPQDPFEMATPGTGSLPGLLNFVRSLPGKSGTEAHTACLKDETAVDTFFPYLNPVAPRATER